jgi:hypothetical protein
MENEFENLANVLSNNSVLKGNNLKVSSVNGKSSHNIVVGQTENHQNVYDWVDFYYYGIAISGSSNDNNKVNKFNIEMNNTI